MAALPRCGGTEPPDRRVRPSDPAWPAATDWERLKADVGGRLIRIKPPLAACSEDPSGTACQTMLRNLTNPFFIGETPGATQSSGWVDAWMAAPSIYAVAAKDATDVAAAIRFAREHNLRLVVKGGGHSFQGTSNAPDSLLIWTRAMNGIVLHDAFVARNCAEATGLPAVSLGSGLTWLNACDAVVTKAGRYVQGGGCNTVGVAGLVQSGGFGSLSKKFGLVASWLLEAEIVTADGAIRIANACTNPDLYWAIKGGGGGTFGVVTRVTLQTHDLPTWIGGATLQVRASSNAAFRHLVGAFLQFYKDRLFNPHWGESVVFRSDNVLSVALVSQGLSTQEAAAVWQPFLDQLAAAPNDYSLLSPPSFGSAPARRWWDARFWEEYAPRVVVIDSRPGAPKGNFVWAVDQARAGSFWYGFHSTWLPASLLEPGQMGRLADTLFKASRNWSVTLQFNKALAGAPEGVVSAARETAINPAVFDAFALAIVAGDGPPAWPGIAGHEPDLAMARKYAALMRRASDRLRQIVPDPGSYLAESDFFEANWQRSFWGDNYARLQAVKAKYDPDGLFFVHHGVGSEAWSDDGFTRAGPR
jgi:FAD/FMN-containing dehydrogenase